MSAEPNYALAEECANLLRRAIRGETPIVAKGSPWAQHWGDRTFLIEGYEVVIFNDCDDLDYIDSVTTPDGRHADYHQLSVHENCSGVLGFLTFDEQDALEKLVKEAPVAG